MKLIPVIRSSYSSAPPIRFFHTSATAIIFLSMISPWLAFGQNGERVIREVKHDVSAPLLELQRLTPNQPRRFSPRILKILPTTVPPRTLDLAVSPLPDATVQSSSPPSVAAVTGLNFEGLGQGEYGFLLDSAPPDTNGAVGSTQYVQWANDEFAVFDKTTGSLVAGPTEGNALWAGFGGGCETNNDGDPIVQYDKIANRWIMSQFSISTLPNLECVAVSTTSDAAGTYYRYSFSLGDNNYPDYPKLGVWPDAYYMSFNIYLNGINFTGADACAADRNAMLAGNAAQLVCFKQPDTMASLLPSDMDGTIQPALGEPAFFMNFGQNVLQLWRFHADFTTPANSTFTGPTVIPVAAFTARCLHACVKQPGTAQLLDAVGDRPMYRLAYRQFPNGVESLTFNHSITSGIRWYEIRDPDGTPTVFQQGTFAPDSKIRWMGSMAMDQAGDVALGYSLSSGTVYPSIYFTGRVAADAASTMEGEQLIVSGSGSQTGNLSRWGDYSAMTVDPVDDCTFWYTQEYIRSNGSFNWSTRIANFNFPNCGPASGASATLSVAKLVFPKTLMGQTSSLPVSVTNGGTATLNLYKTAVSGDYAVQSNTCGQQLLAAGTCTLTIAFTPTTKGTRTGILQLTDNAPTNPQTVALSGTGTSIALSPVALNFGSDPVGQSTAPQTVIVSNITAVAVGLSGFTISGATSDYAISANTCGTSLPANSSCTLNVYFDATRIGTRKGTLNIANKGGAAATATLTGVGTAH